MSEGRQWIGDGLSGISTNGGGIGVAERVEDRMLTLLKRHEVQTLLAAGHDQIEVAVIAGVSVRSVRRIAAEPAVEHVDDSQERVQRRIGRPSKVEPFRTLVQELVEQVDEETHAPLKSVEILRRARLDGSRLRPLRVSPDRLALRIPIQVSVTAEVSYDGRSYAMPPEAASMAGTLYLYQDHVHIVAGRFQARHPRYVAKGTVSRQPEHRAAQLAAISGKRGRRYLQREHLLETGEAVLLLLTELVHRDPRSWFRDAELLHELLQQHGPKTLDRAFQAAVGARTYTTEYVVRCLNGDRSAPTISPAGARRP